MWAEATLAISILRSVLAFFRSRQDQAIVELALRQQLAVYAHRHRRPVCIHYSYARSRSLAPGVAAVKPTDARESDHFGSVRRPAFQGSAGRRIADHGVNAVGVVVLDIFPEQSSEVVLAQDHDVIEKLATKRSAVPFCQGL